MKKTLQGLVIGLIAKSSYAFEFKNTDSKVPFEIQADQGISCNQETNICQAKGNVVVSQGDALLKADTILAYLMKVDDNHKTVARLEAKGNVLVSMKGENKSLTANEGFYDIQKGCMGFSGHPAQLKVDTGWIEARDIQYDEKTHIVTAIGDAYVFKDGATLRAPALKAVVRKTSAQRFSLEEVWAENGLHTQAQTGLSKRDRVAHAAKGRKRSEEGKVTLIRPEGVIVGGKAASDLQDKTGTVHRGAASPVKVLLY